VLGGWDADEIRQLKDMLVRFNRDVEEIEGRPWPRPDGG